MREKKLLAHQEKFNPEKIKLQIGKLSKGQKDILYPTYDKIFKEEFNRLVSYGDSFSKSDFNFKKTIFFFRIIFS